MTEEEAVRALKFINLTRVHPFYSWEEMKEVRDMAIKALEKQIPKKLELEGIDLVVCPTCHRFLGYELDFIDNLNQDIYCKECGQKFNWEDWNDKG